MDTNYKKYIGAKIRSLRTKRQLTQDQLAAKLQVLDCDITRSALAKIEVGQRHIYIDEIKALKKALDVGYDDLIE